MKKMALVLVLCAAALVTGCGFLPFVSGSGVPVTVDYAPGSVTKVTASNGCVVRVVHDSAPSVRVTIDDNLVDHVQVTLSGTDTVAIGLEPGYIYAGVSFSAEVHVVSLAGIDLSGGSSATVTLLQPAVSAFSAVLSGGSTATVQQLSCGTLDAKLSGGSVLSVDGSAPTVIVGASGGSTAHLENLAAHAAGVDLSGASQCWVSVGTGTVDVTASGASTLWFHGSPTLRSVSLSGSSRLVSY